MESISSLFLSSRLIRQSDPSERRQAFFILFTPFSIPTGIYESMLPKEEGVLVWDKVPHSHGTNCSAVAA